jgi:hypothetical protein
MANIIKPPALISAASISARPSLALFGSIEMGRAANWQAQAQTFFTDYDFDIYNPRRDNWDVSWKQEKESKPFFEQVNWELTVLENAQVRLFYFAPDTQSPITLMELGLSVGVGHVDTVVCCPEGFWRKGNVDM